MNTNLYFLHGTAWSRTLKERIHPPPWGLSDKVLSVVPNQKDYALELLFICLFSVPLVLHPTNICFLCELFLIWNISLWTSTWDQRFSFLVSLWGPTSPVEWIWIWYQRGNWERQDILCDAMQGCISFCMHVFFIYFCIWTASSTQECFFNPKQNKTSPLIKDMFQLNHMTYRKEYKTLELPDIQRSACIAALPKWNIVASVWNNLLCISPSHT